MPALSQVVGGQQTSAQVTFFDQYTGGAATPTSGQTAGYVITDGYNGAVMWELVENNVAAGGAIIIEGSFDGSSDPTHWYPVGYYTTVANGTAQSSLSRAVIAVTLTKNTRTVLQCLDAFTYMRARVTANASSASLTAKVYMVPG